MTTYVILDGPANVEIGDPIFLTDSEGVVVSRTVTGIEVGNKYYLSSPIADAPIPASVWATENAELQHQLFRVIGIAEAADGSYEITGVKHEPGKQGWVEDNLVIQPRITTSLIPDVQPAPTNLRIGAYGRAGATSTNAVLTAQWDEAVNAPEYYELQWRKDNGVWSAVQKIFGTVAEHENAFAGTYSFKVVAVNKSKTSPPAFSDALMVGDVPLQPLNEAIQTLVPVAGVVTIDCSIYKNFQLTLDQNVSVQFINVPQSKDLFLQILQMGSYTITWSASIATTYTGPATAATDLVSIKTINFGSSWQLVNNSVTPGGGALSVIISPNYVEFAADGTTVALNVTSIGAVGTPTYAWTRTDTNGGTNFTFSSLSAEDPNVSRFLGPIVPTQVQTWKVNVVDGTNSAEATVTLVAINDAYEDPDPMCLAADSFMYNGGRAYQVAPHELVGVWDRNVDAPGVTTARAVSMILGRQPLYRLTTETCKTVRASASTPMELRDGRTVLVPEMLNEYVVVCDVATDECTWERVATVQYLGVGTVAKIHAGDSMLLAGDDPRWMIATHNIRMKM